MKRLSFMLVAGEASGDMLAAELVSALRAEVATDNTASEPLFEPAFFGAGGPRMAAAGVDVQADLTEHAVIGLSDALKKLHHFRRALWQLVELAESRQPDVIVCVDFSGFNRRFAHAVRQRLRSRAGPFSNWNPRIIQYVSPQVWASREGRIHQLARDYDLLLSIFPFEKQWYSARLPHFPVEFVGHPMVDRHPSTVPRAARTCGSAHHIVLLPGSRKAELKRHLPIVLKAAEKIAAATPASFTMVLPNSTLAEMAKTAAKSIPQVQLQIGKIDQALAGADLAITKSGTITLECAFFGVPAIVFYITSWPTYLIARRIIKVKYLAMPNLLADEPLFPEFIQSDATAEKISRAALDLLREEGHLTSARAKLRQVVDSLGAGGGSRRAAQAILRLVR